MDKDQIQGEKIELKPIGKGAFGDIYDQFKGKAMEAFGFLITHEIGRAHV